MEENTAVADAPAVIVLLPVERIDPSPLNRKYADDDQGVLALAESLAKERLINPIDVRPRAGGRYEIICGEGRWRAFRILGRTEMPCIVMDVDDAQAHILRITENLHRKDLTPMEQGDGVAALLQVCDNKYSEVAARLGYSEAWVRRRAKLPNLIDVWRTVLLTPDSHYAALGEAVERLEELAILPAATQQAIFDAGLLTYVRTTEDMRKKLARFFRNLDHKPWSYAWEKKCFSSGKRCEACQKRSDKELTLFDDLNAAAAADAGKEKTKLCLDPDCWCSRVLAWCKHLLQQNPGAVLLKEGAFDVDYERRIVAELGSTPLANWMWRERTGDEAVGSYCRPATGIFVGGGRVGEVQSIWIQDADEEEEADEEVKDRTEARQREREQAEQRDRDIERVLSETIPEDVSVLQERGNFSFEDMALNLLNWCVWYGIGSLQYDEDEAKGFEVLDISSARMGPFRSPGDRCGRNCCRRWRTRFASRARKCR